MRYSPLVPTFALAGALVLGCTEQSTPTDPSTRPAPSLKAETIRDEIPFTIFLGSGNPDITALFGVPPDELSASCDGAESTELVERIAVTHPTSPNFGGLLQHIRIREPELSAVVWPIDLGEGGDLCDLVEQGVEPLVGTVRLMVNDNEGEFFSDAPGANAFSIRLVGTVTDQETGQRYHIQGWIQIVVLPDGSEKFLPNPFLKLTPMGG
jgi:hypothetical protein